MKPKRIQKNWKREAGEVVGRGNLSRAGERGNRGGDPLPIDTWAPPYSLSLSRRLKIKVSDKLNISPTWCNSGIEKVNMNLVPMILIWGVPLCRVTFLQNCKIWVFQSCKSELIWNLWNCNFYDFLTRKIHELQFGSLGSILHWLARMQQLCKIGKTCKTCKLVKSWQKNCSSISSLYFFWDIPWKSFLKR